MTSTPGISVPSAPTITAPQVQGDPSMSNSEQLMTQAADNGAIMTALGVACTTLSNADQTVAQATNTATSGSVTASRPN